jgi:hypothetical protein
MRSALALMASPVVSLTCTVRSLLSFCARWFLLPVQQLLSSVIASLLQDARGKLNEPDDLIKGLDDEDSETDFTKGYFSVRKINDRRGRGKSINNNTNNEAQSPTANAA